MVVREHEVAADQKTGAKRLARIARVLDAADYLAQFLELYVPCNEIVETRLFLDGPLIERDNQMNLRSPYVNPRRVQS